MPTPLETKTKAPGYRMFLTGPKRKVLTGILIIIIALSILLANYLPSKFSIPIIMYHRVLLEPKPEYKLSVSARALEWQLGFLKRNHYNVVPLEKLADFIASGQKIPSRTIAITFDDGYKDNYTNAFPVLKKYNLPVTIFLIVQEIGRPDRLSWDEIKIMRDSGFITFGSHAIGPEPLVNINSEEELKRQVFDSRKILEDKLGRPVKLFSYPEGMLNSHIRQLVIDAGYRLAVATKAPGYPKNDIYALKRMRISEGDFNIFIFWFKTRGFYSFFKERKPK